VDLPEKPVGNLRTGFTTGTSATAASVAAVLSIINQKKTKSVDVLLPKKSRITININRCIYDCHIDLVFFKNFSLDSVINFKP